MTTQPKPTLAVCRHPNLITVLRERGVIDDATQVLEHVGSPEQVQGQHVIGVLPHHLSAKAASITEVPMRWSAADREALQRGDVDVEGTRKAAGDPVTYVVMQVRTGGIEAARPRWLAWAKAIEYVERLGYHFGAGPCVMPHWQLYKGLTCVFIYDESQQIGALVCPSRGVWNIGGPGGYSAGKWRDGYDREVDPSTIAGAMGWTGPDWTDA